MEFDRLQVLYEDNHLLALLKPAGLPTMGVAEGVPSLLTLAKDYIRQRYRKPGNVYLGAVSRLDAPVSGVVVLARTSKAASRLTEQFRTRSVEKCYWAIVEGRISPAAGELVDWMVKDERHRKMHLAEKNQPGSQMARLSYRRLASLGNDSLLEVMLETGRKHQIRLQLAALGFPVVGDRKYGGRQAFPDGIALHARRIEFVHPTRGETIHLTAPLPKAWQVRGLNEGAVGSFS